MNYKYLPSYLCLILTALVWECDLSSQVIPEALLKNKEYRFAGPYRGGRATTVTGVPGKPHTFYCGYTGGGVWKTDDAGHHWTNISDGQIKCGSIGSIAVSPASSQTILVGTGSDSPRGNISSGIGMYKSIDGGRNWKHVGMNKCGQIGDIVYNHQDPDIVYAAALGNIFGPNEERGVYKSTDGGDSWEQVFFLNDTTGAVDLAIHPENPNIIYAGMWRAERKPWTMIDGGLTGGLYRSVDAGKNWQRIINGLPEGLIGKIGIAISPVNPDRIWVIQQAADETKGGVYRSDDGGAQFKRINRDHRLRQRGWYYTRIFADPVDEHTVYVTNTGFYKSIDGGKNFDTRFFVPHGDCHDVWINPTNPQIIINSNDGGATVSLNGGKTWSTPNNQPTSEFYRLSVDNQFPYYLYAGQQDNTTIAIPSRRMPGIHPQQHWQDVGGGESADVAVHPEQPHIVYATTYSGIITRKNTITGERRDIGAYPHYTEGTAQRDLKYRWQWNFPIRVSKHNPDVLYHTSNYVHRSVDEGQTWTVISPDLTNNIAAYQDIPGGPIQHDATGVEVYSTIFSFEEDPHEPLVLWAGSDDGKIYVTKNGGQNWEDITPEQMPKEGTVNALCPSVHTPGKIYAAVYRYRDNDPAPYLFVSTDYGKSWSKKIEGIPENHFIRAIAEDEEVPGLLFAGTEFGMYLSIDDGTTWTSFQQNLPHTPITDLLVHQGDLVLSTQGRGFWIMDDLSLIRSLNQELPLNGHRLFPVSDSYRTNLGGRSGWGHSPPGAPYQVDIHFFLDAPDTSATVALSIIDGNGIEVWRRSSDAKKEEEKLMVSDSMNLVTWDQRYPKPELVNDLVMMDMRFPGQGPKAPAGRYTVELKVGDDRSETEFAILKDPRWEISDEDLKANFDLANEISALLTESQRRLINLRSIREQVDGVNELLKERSEHPEIIAKGNELARLCLDTEDLIYQRQIETSQDEINYPRKFTNHLIRLYRVVINQDNQPSGGELERWQDLKANYSEFDEAYKNITGPSLNAYLQEVTDAGIPFIVLPKE